MFAQRTFRLALVGSVLLFAAACDGSEPLDLSRGPDRSGTSGTAQRQMVAAAHPLAAEAGLEILRSGGSAADAAIAMQMVLTLVEPQSSGIGGGAFLLHWTSDTGDIDAYDGRETAPATASPGMFLRPDGKPMEFYEAAVGGLAIGVPGTLRMLEAVHRDHGRLPWARLFEAAIRLSEDGFPVSRRLHESIAKDEHLRTDPAAAAHFYRPDGSPREIGETLRNPLLAETLKQVAAAGANVFYEGPIADDVVAAVQTAMRNPGGLAPTDLAAYRPVRRDPLCRPYRQWRVCVMPPPTSGGVAILQVLGVLSGYDLPEMEPGSAAAVHLVAEASRLAFADRARYIADPDFVSVPVEELLDPAYLRERAALISPERSMGDASPGKIGSQASWAPAPVAAEPMSTSHLAVVDADGNAVSLTSSIESAFGSRVMVRGFLLNNQLTDFAFRPSRDGRLIANRAAPGKRPRSSMSPTFVFDRDGRLVLTVGSPGGSAIIGYALKSLIAVLDWGLDPQSAVDLPNFLNRNGPTEIEEDTSLEEIVTDLKELGHKIEISELNSGLHVIQVTPEGLIGGADRRREGVAIGD